MGRHRTKVDFQTLAQRSGDSLQHGERMSVVVGVFQPGDIRLLCTHQGGELPLCESGLGSRVMDQARDLSVDGLSDSLLSRFLGLFGIGR